jgi:hypothetical protein
MHETIRSRIKRRVRWCTAVGISGWVVIVLTTSMHVDGKPPSPLIAVGFLIFFGAVVAIQWAIRCPRCSARLGQEMGMRIGLSLFGKKQPNFCPYCGVSLDEPCSPDTGRTPAQTQDPIK